VRQPYFLYLGTLQPRKNLARLIEAFGAIDFGHFERPPSLVIAGKPGWLHQDLSAQVARLGLERRIAFPGYVSDEDKAPLISGAIAFVFPSLYEGFGLPVVEAQACGCPVVTSNSSSLPEAAGQAALLVDPHDTSAISHALLQVAIDDAMRTSLSERGLANARRFSWEACARIVLHAIERCSPAVRPTAPG
jgi:glycosyltransferase involved in cell wall biosynthesis